MFGQTGGIAPNSGLWLLLYTFYLAPSGYENVMFYHALIVKGHLVWGFFIRSKLIQTVAILWQQLGERKWVMFWFGCLWFCLIKYMAVVWDRTRTGGFHMKDGPNCMLKKQIWHNLNINDTVYLFTLPLRFIFGSAYNEYSKVYRQIWPTLRTLQPSSINLFLNFKWHRNECALKTCLMRSDVAAFKLHDAVIVRPGALEHCLSVSFCPNRLQSFLFLQLANYH